MPPYKGGPRPFSTDCRLGGYFAVRSAVCFTAIAVVSIALREGPRMGPQFTFMTSSPSHRSRRAAESSTFRESHHPGFPEGRHTKVGGVLVSRISNRSLLSIKSVDTTKME